MFKLFMGLIIVLPNIVVASSSTKVTQDAVNNYLIEHQGLDPSQPSTWTVITPPPAGPYQTVKTNYINDYSVINLVGKISSALAGPSSNPEPNLSPPSNSNSTSDTSPKTDPNAITYGY